jgi:hypothetical protein
MIVHNTERIPEGLTYPSVDDHSELASYELDDLAPLELDEIWYWYWAGGYEGGGQLLMRRGDQYDIHDMGHCSCYGPTDSVDFVGQPLDVLAARFSDERLREVAPLIELARSHAAA